jgi:hypothetical protein
MKEKMKILWLYSPGPTSDTLGSFSVSAPTNQEIDMHRLHLSDSGVF